MIRIYPFIFILLWSSALITTKPIVDNSDPFSALAFRFFFVAIGFCIYSLYSKNAIKYFEAINATDNLINENINLFTLN